jgi:hypothetical protein
MLGLTSETVQIKNLNERLRAESAGAEKYFNIIINII